MLGLAGSKFEKNDLELSAVFAESDDFVVTSPSLISFFSKKSVKRFCKRCELIYKFVVELVNEAEEASEVLFFLRGQGFVDGLALKGMEAGFIHLETRTFNRFCQNSIF